MAKLSTTDRVQSKGETARRRSPQSPFENNHARLINALEAAHQGVWQQSINDADNYYSPVWYRMRGYQPDAPLDNTMEGWLLRVHPDDHEHVCKAVETQKRSRDENNVFEYRERHAIGHYIWIQCRGRAVAWDDNGNATLILGTDTDITRQKQLEMDVANERQRLRVMLGSITDAVIATNASGHISYMNPSAANLILRSEAISIGMPLQKIFTLTDEDMQPVDPLEQCRQQGSTWENKNLMLHLPRTHVRDVRCVVSVLHQSGAGEEGFVVVLEDVSLSRQLERRLVFLANHDTLTRLPNRNAFEVTIEKVVAAARAGEAAYSLCSIDLDRFKIINDTLGHAAGDYALQQVVFIMNQWKQPDDYIARLGGDEFIVIMRDSSAHKAEQRMTVLQQEVARMNGMFEAQPFELGLSFGIAQVNKATINSDQVLRLADSRCYAHKNRDRTCLPRPATTQRNSSTY